MKKSIKIGFLIILFLFVNLRKDNLQLSTFNFQLVRSAYATTDQQAFRQQQILQQQQEQQRQFQEQQQNINEIRNIRDSRVKEGVIEDSNTPVRPVVVQNKCDVGYNECIGKCRQGMNAPHQTNTEQAPIGLTPPQGESDSLLQNSGLKGEQSELGGSDSSANCLSQCNPNPN